MTRRGNSASRCDVCRLHGALCLCALVPRLETRTRVLIVMHRDEVRKTTNTGRLAAACLVNSEILVRGRVDTPDPDVRWPAETQPLLLFPHPGARPLTDFIRSERAVTLIVPDGTFRQASKMKHRVPELRDVPAVALPAGPPSSYRLRVQPAREHVSTIEAIARALAVLEGPDAARALEAAFRIMVERTLAVRGTDSASL